jgi:uncharacterized protein (DUF1499 family)
MQRSRLAVVCGFLGALGIFDAVLGPVLIHLGILRPFTGFLFFASGLLFGLLAIVLAPFAFYATRGGRRTGRGLVLLGFACGAALLLGVGLSRQGASGLPRINDITTDLADPPTFPNDPADMGRDMSYPAAFAPQVQQAYADLAPIHVSSDPAQALALADQTARGLGWEVVSVEQGTGILYARDTSKLFMFVDDIVVRVRPADGGGAVVDVRSKSRVGQGDLGANAARIRRFSEQLPR